MKKKRKLKKYVMPVVYTIAFSTLLMTLIMLDSLEEKPVMDEDENYIYVNSSIITNYIPVEKQEKTIIKPYTYENVEISKNFYDSSSSEEEKSNALIYYNDTYMQNSGVLYKADQEFDVLSILDGTVLSVKEDEVLGKVIEIKHTNGLISTYQGLSVVNVKNGQLLNQGDIIGKSGKLNLGESIDNSLLFELIIDGKYVNPLNYLNKNINEI